MNERIDRARFDVPLRIEEMIGDYLNRVTYSDLSQDAINQAQRAVMWWCATVLEGSRESECPALRSHLEYVGGRGESTVLGGGLRLPAEAAALMNARGAKAFEHEDKFWADETIGVAIGCSVVSAVVAMAQALGRVSGADLLCAVAVAIDLEARIVRSVDPAFFYGRVPANGTFVLGNYGAAIGAAKVLGADALGFLNTLGLAHGQAAGNLQGQLEGRGVSIQNGFAARNGVSAARMAARGMRGPHEWLTGRAGLFAVHFAGSDEGAGTIVMGLGEEFLGADLAFKAYPCGIVAQPAMDALRSLRSEIVGKQIEAIRVVGPESLRIMAEPIDEKRLPRSAVEAQFSIPWALACLVRDDQLTIDHYSDESLEDEELRKLASLVTVELDNSVTASLVEVHLGEGSIVRYGPVSIARGHPRNPLTNDEIIDLLVSSARRVGMVEPDIVRSVHLLDQLDSVIDIDEVFSLLAGPRWG